jgi:acetyl-CoA carboxylase carboxyl transferase subunit alpha
MAQPEGYRKAKRLFQLAERFSLPVLTFIDTAGAYPGVEGEERGQSEAIAQNLAVMSKLRTPIIVVVTGEGGSGGALAIGVGDHVAIFEHAIYSVASPEACASIVWRSSENAPDAAEAMKVSAQELIKIGIVDEIIPEPSGGAHRDYEEMAMSLKKSITDALSRLDQQTIEEMLESRYQRLLRIGS